MEFPHPKPAGGEPPEKRRRSAAESVPRPAVGVAQATGILAAAVAHSMTTDHQGSGTLPMPGGPLMFMKSHLEVTSVSSMTQSTYTEATTQFTVLCRQWGLDWSSDEELDAIIVYVLDHMFFNNQPAHQATTLVAALRWFAPRYRRGGEGHLPRAIVALNAFAHRRPGNQRLPIPWVIACAIIGSLLHKGERWMALQVVVSFWCYLRPSEGDRLRPRDLVAPSHLAGTHYQHWGLLLSPSDVGRPGKTGQFDESIILDNLQGLDPLFRQLSVSRAKEARLWPHSAEQFLAKWNQVIVELELGALNPCRYALRHGGASEDILSRQRLLADVKRRGRWVSDSSLKRYGKETRLLSELLKVHPNVLAFGREVMRHFEALMLGFRRPPSMPAKGAVSPRVLEKMQQLAASAASRGSLSALK